MWDGKSLAVVLPTFRERATIRQFILDLESLGLVDEILVVNNNAELGTSDEVADTSAREIYEARQGYGAAIRRGLEEADSDLVVIVEPDGTFDALDVWKLLAYSRDFDFVYGSRTLRDLIWDGANMGRFLRWGNWAVAKLLEVLFNTSSLSDIGCTMRLAKRDALRVLQPYYTVSNSAFGPEMMLLSIIGGWRVLQVPVNYKARVGAPGTTESFGKALTIGLQMVRLILSYRGRRDQLAAKLAVARSAPGPPGPTPGHPSPGGEPSHMLPWLPRRRRPRVLR